MNSFLERAVRAIVRTPEGQLLLRRSGPEGEQLVDEQHADQAKEWVAKARQALPRLNALRQERAAGILERVDLISKAATERAAAQEKLDQYMVVERSRRADLAAFAGGLDRQIAAADRELVALSDTRLADFSRLVLDRPLRAPHSARARLRVRDQIAQAQSEGLDHDQVTARLEGWTRELDEIDRLSSRLRECASLLGRVRLMASADVRWRLSLADQVDVRLRGEFDREAVSALINEVEAFARTHGETHYSTEPPIGALDSWIPVELAERV